MSTIISGRFDEMEHARQALERFSEQGFDPSEYACYADGAPSHQELFSANSEAARAAAGGAIGGAIGGATGLAVGSLGGPLGAAAGAAVGVCVGSLAGSMAQPGQPATKPTKDDPPAANGTMVAVCADRPGTEAAAIAILSASGAREIDRSEGEWRDGGWADYDPAKPTEVLLKANPSATG